MVLVVVLVVVALLSLAALTFSELMLTEREAAELSLRRIQARAAADSGVETARVLLALDAETQKEANGVYDNPERFAGQIVVPGDIPRDQCRFSIIAPDMANGQFAGIRHGLEDESARLNLNAVLQADETSPGSGRELLMGLPGMTEEIADAILDWIDSDPDPREFGCEDEYYTALNPPYSAKNRPLETIEELLLVRGVTPELLFGVDENRNGAVDPNERDPMSIADADNSDGSMNRGWSAYLTLWSAESNLRPDGQMKININQEDMQTLFDEASAVAGPETARYIVACRQGGPPATATGLRQPFTGQLDLTKPGKYTFKAVIELIGTEVKVNSTDYLQSPFPNIPGSIMNGYFPLLFDNFTTRTKPVIPARININTAPRVILLGVPGLSEEMVDQIISLREPDPAKAESHRRYETWLLSESVVSLDEMKALVPYICGSGSVYRAQVVGYFDHEGPDVRIEAILDATKRPTRVLFWRDMSHLGIGYTREMLGGGVTE